MCLALLNSRARRDSSHNRHQYLHHRRTDEFHRLQEGDIALRLITTPHRHCVLQLECKGLVKSSATHQAVQQDDPQYSRQKSFFPPSSQQLVSYLFLSNIAPSLRKATSPRAVSLSPSLNSPKACGLENYGQHAIDPNHLPLPRRPRSQSSCRSYWNGVRQ